MKFYDSDVMLIIITLGGGGGGNLQECEQPYHGDWMMITWRGACVSTGIVSGSFIIGHNDDLDVQFDETEKKIENQRESDLKKTYHIVIVMMTNRIFF